MKFLHISDLHIGKRVNEFSMIEDQKHILRQILGIVEREQAGAVLIAGDIYDKPVPSAEAVQIFDSFLTELADRGKRVFVVSGNHDSPERIAFGAQLMSGRGVHISPVYGGEIRGIPLTDEYGEIFVYLLPFVKPATVRHALEHPALEHPAGTEKCGGTVASERLAGVEAHRDALALECLAGTETRRDAPASERLAGMETHRDALASECLAGAENRNAPASEYSAGEEKQQDMPLLESYQDAVKTAIDRMHIDPEKRNILVAHQFVTGAGRCDSEDAAVGGLDNVDAEVFDGFDYVALGHIHSPQSVKRESVRYCGTPLKYSFSEAEQVKSVTILEMREKGSMEISTVPLVPLRDMRKIRGTYLEVTAKTFYQDFDREDYVQVTLTDEEDIPDGLQKLRIIYPNLMRLSYDNRRTRQENSLEAAEAVERKSELDIFGEFYELQNNQPMSGEQTAFVENIIERLRCEG